MDDPKKENRHSHLKIRHSGDLPEESFLQIALRYRWTILGTIIVFIAAAFIYLLKATPIYTGASRIYVEQSGPRLINDYEGVMTQSKNYLYTQSELIKSTPIISDIVEDPQIRNFKLFNGVDNPVSYLKSKLDVEIGKKDDIITVSLDAPYPEEAVQIVNKAVNSYIEYQSLHKRSTVSEVLKILQREKVKRDQELSEKYEELLDFTKTYGIVSYDENGKNVAFQELSKLADALTEVRLDAIMSQSDYEAIKGMSDDPEMLRQYVLSQPLTGVRIIRDDETKLKTDLKVAEVEYEKLKNRVTPDHPALQSMQEKIMYIKSQLQKESMDFAEDYIEVAKLRSITAKQREEELLAAFETQKVEVKEEGVKATEYMVIQSELRRLENISDILDNRIKEISVAEDSGALNISILEVAHMPDKPSSPQKAKILFLSLLLGLIAGGGLALLRDWLDPRIRSAEEISAILGVGILGTVPRMEDDSSFMSRPSTLRFEFKSFMIERCQHISKSIPFLSKWFAGCTSVFNATENTLEKHKRMMSGLKVDHDPQSIAAEAYRTIRTAVFFGGHKSHVKTILVTSPSPGDGKSTLISNLATAMAQAGQRTLIIDADFRKPTQHKIFDDDLGKGIMTLFAGEDTLDETIQQTSVEGLDILYHGPESANPSETLNSERFSELLKTLRDRYDRILIDSPPVGPVADSRILAALTDAVILVLRAGKSTRRESMEACENMLNVGGNMLGVVVNDVQRRHGGYGYGYGGYGYGGYGYGYGSYGKKIDTEDRIVLAETDMTAQTDMVRDETAKKRKLKKLA